MNESAVFYTQRFYLALDNPKEIFGPNSRLSRTIETAHKSRLIERGNLRTDSFGNSKVNRRRLYSFVDKDRERGNSAQLQEVLIYPDDVQDIERARQFLSLVVRWTEYPERLCTDINNLGFFSTPERNLDIDNIEGIWLHDFIELEGSALLPFNNPVSRLD